MVTVPSSLIVPFLRYSGANRSFVTAEGARRRVRQRELRPRPYGPPGRLRPDVLVGVGRGSLGWPV